MSEIKKLMIALVGESGAGKSTSSAHLADQGFHLITIAASLRAEASARFGVPSREQVQQHAQETQAAEGNEIYAVKALAKLKDAAQYNVVLDGLRNSEELAYSKTLAAKSGYGFALVALRVPSETRFSRVVDRKRDGDPISREVFDLADMKALGDGDNGFQQNGYLIEVADHLIQNTGDLVALKTRLDAIVEKEST
jgi:dephospho-CoA kinase